MEFSGEAIAFRRVPVQHETYVAKVEQGLLRRIQQNVVILR